ncbi:MAG: type II toxin-antitoxin system VapC family toxin [Lachnospiraceae bacterium]|nr:type II toxin-antitoxin system VapC family toxin [Lachnospiraceae bacterium]
MKVLIDTHIAIWAISDDAKLSKVAKDILTDESNEIYYSTASIWEIIIKHMAHPEKVIIDGDTLAKSCENTGFKVLPILNRHTFALKDLKYPNDNDPFDRIMIAQAKIEEMKFLTHDSLIPYYSESFIISV